MLIPSRTKYRRVHRLPYEGHAKGNTKLDKGEILNKKAKGGN